MADASLAPLMAAIQGGTRRHSPLDRQRAFADSIIKQGSDTSPVRSPLEGLARALTGAVGSGLAVYTDSQQKEKSKAGIEALAGAINAKTPEERAAFIGKLDPDNEYTQPMLGQILASTMAEQQKTANQQRAGDNFAGGYSMPAGGSAPQGAAPPPQPQQGGDMLGAISNIESNGRYDAVGPVANAKGNRAYGKYQVLDTNIGPWTQEILGKAMTPQEFLQNPQAQDTVARTKLGQYEKQFGSPEAAARAWFAGPGGMNNPNAADVNGMTVQNYGQKFSQGYGGGGTGAAPPQAAPVTVQATPPAAGGQPAPLTINMSGAGVPQGSADPSGTPLPPQGAQPPAIPDVPRPQPSPQIIQALRYKIQTGQMTPQQAEQELQTQVNQEWQVQRERAKMAYEQQAKQYDFDRKQGVEGPKQSFDQEKALRDDFNGIQSVKDYRKANTVFKSAVEAAKTDSAAADLNMVYAFATLMDPGSVVRDSETGMVLATQNASDRIKSMVASVTGGQRISPEGRQNLLREMGVRYEAYKGAHDSIKDTFKGIAGRSGVNADNIIVDTPDVPYERMPATAAKGTAPAQGAAPTAAPQEYDYVPGKGLVPRR